MIGLLFLGAALLWLALSGFLAIHLPKWFGISKPPAQWLTSAAVFLILLVGPFVDHVVGMQQFEKLCAEQMNVRVSPQAANVKRARHSKGKDLVLPSFMVKITKSEIQYFDRDTEMVVAQYNYFTTPGGKIGGLVRLGSPYTCFSSPAVLRPGFDQLTPIRQKTTSN